MRAGPALIRSSTVWSGTTLLDRLPRRQVQQVDRLLLVRGERQIASDHDAFGDGRIAAEPELGRDEPLVHVARPRERGLLAVHRDPAAGDRVVLEGPAQPRRRLHGTTVLGEA